LALILGASKFEELLRLNWQHGYTSFGVHLDRQITMPKVQQLIKRIEHTKQQAVFLILMQLTD
jgi:hypothetical protein